MKFEKVSICVYPKKTVDGVVHPPWFTKTLRKLKNQKNQADVKFKKTNIYTDYAAYSLLSKKYAALQSSEYNQYLSRTQANLIQDPSKFWSYVASKKKASGYPATMSHNNQESSTEGGICELFGRFFKIVYIAVDSLSVCVEFESDGNLPGISERVCLGSINLSRDEILKSLLSINVNKGGGPDDIPLFS